MVKGSVLAGLDAQRHATIRRLGAVKATAWHRPTVGGLTVGELAEWLAAADEAAARGRLRGLAAPRPVGLVGQGPGAAHGPEGGAPPDRHDRQGGPRDGADAAALLHRLDRAGKRLRRAARILPGVLWQTRVDGDDGLRRPLVCLLRLRILREWVAIADPALGPPVWPAPSVAPVLAQAALARLPVEVLPNVDVHVGVLRVALADLPGQPAKLAWGVDFARKHYGPRVESDPDAVVRTWSGALARLLEGEVGWTALPAVELRVEGDEALAAAWLAALPGTRGIRS